MAYFDDWLLSEGLSKLRKKFIKPFINGTSLKVRSCNVIEFYIFDYDGPAERGIMKVDFGKYNKTVIELNGSLTEELSQEETKHLKDLLPEIENEVNSKVKSADFKIIAHDSTLKVMSAHLNFIDWFCVLDIEMRDGYRETMVYPENNSDLKQWSALFEPRPKFLQFYNDKKGMRLL